MLYPRTTNVGFTSPLVWVAVTARFSFLLEAAAVRAERGACVKCTFKLAMMRQREEGNLRRLRENVHGADGVFVLIVVPYLRGALLRFLGTDFQASRSSFESEL